jgi:hypothetical protein
MPAKGTRKKNPNPTPSTHLKISLDLHDRLDKTGRANGIINPRNGQGNRHEVIERLFAQLPVFSRAKAVLELCIEHLPPDKQAIAESVLLELEDLDIEQAYEEARIEGDLPELKAGAWII